MGQLAQRAAAGAASLALGRILAARVDPCLLNGRLGLANWKFSDACHYQMSMQRLNTANFQLPSTQQLRFLTSTVSTVAGSSSMLAAVAAFSSAPKAASLGASTVPVCRLVRVSTMAGYCKGLKWELNRVREKRGSAGDALGAANTEEEEAV